MYRAGGFSCIPTEDGMVHVCVPPGTAGPTPYAAPEGTPDDVRTLYGKNNCSAAPGAPGPVPASLTVLLILLAARLHDRRRRRRSA